MKRISPVFSLLLLAVTILTFSSCTKEVTETITKTDTVIIRRDSIIIRHDSIISKQDIAKLLTKKWFFQSHEIETYSGTTQTSKKVENFSSTGFFNQFNAGGAYTNFDLGGNSNGSWELVDDNLYVYDKNTVNERYYYILSISATAFINRGPYTKTNLLHRDYLATAYFKSVQ